MRLITLFLLFCNLLRYFLIHLINSKQPSFTRRRIPYRYSTRRTWTKDNSMGYTAHIGQLWLTTTANKASKFLFRSQRDHCLEPTATVWFQRSSHRDVLKAAAAEATLDCNLKSSIFHLKRNSWRGNNKKLWQERQHLGAVYVKYLEHISEQTFCPDSADS